VAGKHCQKDTTASRSVRIFLTLFLLASGTAGWAATSEPAPGLIVGEVEIQTRDIFSQDEIEEATSLLRIMRRGMNGLHVNTRRRVIRRELLFSAGDEYRPATLAETERNLRSLGFLRDVAVTATDTAADGRVNIRVSARETWSLNTALTYTRASGGNQRWSFSLSDRNVLGHGLTMGAGLGSNEIGSYTNLWFSKRRALGTPFQVGAYFDQPTDGYRRGFTITRPFYAMDGRWSLNCRAWDYEADSRYFLSNASPVGTDPAREASLYAELPRAQTGFEAGFQIRIGGNGITSRSAPNGGGHKSESGSRIWRLGAGARIVRTEHQVGDQPYWILSDGRWTDLQSLLDQGEPLDRNQGTVVFPYVHIETLGRSWTKRRFVVNYGPVEDVPLAWSMDLKLGPNGRGLGSTAGTGGESIRSELVVSRFVPLRGGFFRLQGAGYAQAGAKDNRTYRYDLLTGWITARGPDETPWLTRIHAEYGQGGRLAANEGFLLGLDRGIRTLEFDGMAGDRLARWNLEQGKVLPWTPLGLFKSGAAVFYSGGCAWWNDEDRNLGDARHEVGLGLRFGPTRSSRAQTTRIDLTWNADEFSSGPVLTTTTRGTF
jgi:Surface antigen variable number repeat